MAFQKGHSGYKPKKPNKRTKEAIERVEWVLGILEETLEQDIKKLSPQQKSLMWKDLQEYVRPKLARTEMKHEGEIAQRIEIKVIEPS